MMVENMSGMMYGVDSSKKVDGEIVWNREEILKMVENLFKTNELQVANLQAKLSKSRSQLDDVLALVMKNPKFKAKPTSNALYEDDEYDEGLKDILDSEGYVHGWYADGYILGDVVEVDPEYIIHEFWIQIDKKTLMLDAEGE